MIVHYARLVERPLRPGNQNKDSCGAIGRERWGERRLGVGGVTEGYSVGFHVSCVYILWFHHSRMLVRQGGKKFNAEKKYFMVNVHKNPRKIEFFKKT